MLEAHGRKVEYVADINQGALDHVVLQMAEDLRSVLVTKNRKHFAKLWNRSTSRAGRRYLHAGMIYLRLKDREIEAARRMEECLGLIEYEWSRVKDLDDRKIIIDLHLDMIRVSR